MLVQIQKQTDVMSNGGEDDELDRPTYAQLLLDKKRTKEGRMSTMSI
jgi:hypothetical protein